MFRKFVYLLALSREKHFGRAAESCHVSQPTLSNAIRQLEEELQVPIVERGQKFEGFTPEGLKVLEYARRIVGERDNLRHELLALAQGVTGHLRLGAIPTALPAVPHVLAPFAARFPHIRSTIVSLSSREIQRGLDEFELDAAITYLDNEPLNNVRTLPLYTERYHLLARRDEPAHMDVLAAEAIEPIDLVAVNLYPFEQTVAADDVDPRTAIENIDIGGPTMIRAAAKNHEGVAVVVKPEAYDAVCAELEESGGEISGTTRHWLANEAFAQTARYDAAISRWFSTSYEDEDFPEHLAVAYEKVLDLSYGENPHQRAALYRVPGGKGIAAAHVLGEGKQLSYNNLQDAAGAYATVADLKAPAVVVVKHSNPCGAAAAGSLLEAFRRAWEGDPHSAATLRPLAWMCSIMSAGGVPSALAMSVILGCRSATSTCGVAVASVHPSSWSASSSVLSSTGTPWSESTLRAKSRWPCGTMLCSILVRSSVDMSSAPLPSYLLGMTMSTP